MAINWEGYQKPIAGFIDLTVIKITLPDGLGNCSGKVIPTSSSSGKWKVKCSNGVNAAGSYKTNGSGLGSSGEGYDSDGNKVEYTISAK